jgi:RNA polymerase sigma factor (sigma-70 family)
LEPAKSDLQTGAAFTSWREGKEVMEAGSRERPRVTEAELSRAERGLIALLRSKGFPGEWIERHVREVMAQARSDFAVRLAAGREDDTINLLVVIAYRRAMKVLREQKTRPATTSIEEVFHLADESTPTPEEETLDHDRQARLLKALSRLPERDRKLLALVYFEEMSVREAGRRLGWGKSSADRHHGAALDRLRALIGDRDLLGIEIAVPSAVLIADASTGRALVWWMQGTAESAWDSLTLAAGRLGSVLEPGNAAAISSAGRATAGACGVAVLCMTAAATGVIGPGVIANAEHRPSFEKLERVGELDERSTTDVARNGPAATAKPPMARPSPKPRKASVEGRSEPASEAVQPSPERHHRPQGVAPAPAASPEEIRTEFEIVGGDTHTAPPPIPSSPLPPATRSYGTSESSPDTSSAPQNSSSSSATATEFGM